MEMQPEAESYVGQVSCGGAVRRVDTGVLSELRRRVKPEVEETRERAASASLAADAMPMAGFVPADAESENDLDARRKTLRRRAVIGLAIAAIGIAAACWEYLPSVLTWLADPQAVRARRRQRGDEPAHYAWESTRRRSSWRSCPASPSSWRVATLLASGRVRRCASCLGGCDFGNLLDDAPVGLALGGVVFRSKPVRPVFLAQQCQAP